MNERISILGNVIISPAKAFRNISGRGRDFLLGAAIIIAISMLISVASPFYSLKNLALGAVSFAIYLVGIYYIGSLREGKANFLGLFSAMGYAELPSIFSYSVLAFIARSSENIITQIIQLKELPKDQVISQATPLFRELLTPLNIGLGSLIAALGIWGFALKILACRESHRFGTGKALSTLIIVGFIMAMAMKMIKPLFGA